MFKKVFLIVASLLCFLSLSSCDSSSISNTSTSGDTSIKTSTNDSTTDTGKTKNDNYSITVSSYENGSITVNKTTAKSGDTITVIPNANTGYMLDTTKLSYVGSDSTYEYKISNGSFTMPAFNITIKAVFVKACSVNFIVNGALEYTEVVKEGSIPTEYRNHITNQYHALNIYTNPSCTRFYGSTKITEDTTLYCTRKLDLFSNVSANKNKVEYSATGTNDMLANVITNAKCTLYKEAYFKIPLKIGELAIVTTDTKYQKMSSYLMLSLAGARGEALNGGTFNSFTRTEDFYGHNVLIFSVTQPGDYYVAVTYSPEALEQFGASFLSTFEYVFDVTAVINDGYLL